MKVLEVAVTFEYFPFAVHIYDVVVDMAASVLRWILLESNANLVLYVCANITFLPQDELYV